MCSNEPFFPKSYTKMTNLNTCMLTILCSLTDSTVNAAVQSCPSYLELSNMMRQQEHVWIIGIEWIKRQHKFVESVLVGARDWHISKLMSEQEGSAEQQVSCRFMGNDLKVCATKCAFAQKFFRLSQIMLGSKVNNEAANKDADLLWLCNVSQ